MSLVAYSWATESKQMTWALDVWSYLTKFCVHSWEEVAPKSGLRPD